MPNALTVLFQMTFAMIATAIIPGSLANRVKIHTWLIFTAVWVLLVYAPMAHMVWGGGLLGEGANSLSAWLFGTHQEGAETVANIAPIDFAGGTVIHINAGVVGGVLASYSVSLKYRLGFDDSLDVVGLHLAAGLWGTIAPGLFATDRGLLTGGGADGAKLLAVQVLIAIIAAAFGGVLTAVIALILKRTLGWRISAEEENTGIDVTHHHERAYHALVDAVVAQRE